MSLVTWFADITIDDVPLVGGKNASLGEMHRELGRAGVRVPDGFAVTAEAYRRFVDAGDLAPTIATRVAAIDTDDVGSLTEGTRSIRDLVLASPVPEELRRAIESAYSDLCEASAVEDVEVAVRSSATAEDLPEASFAGQQETFLMVRGPVAVTEAVVRCFASLYTARAVSYRRHMGIDEQDIALSVAVQRMVRSDLASSGVMFTLDTESGFRDVVYVTSTWGLGETIVQGQVTPDGFYVHKDRLRQGYAPLVGRTLGSKELSMTYDPDRGRVVTGPTRAAERTRFSISDEDALQLAHWGLIIEDHYSEVRGTPTPMDVEWAKDGRTGELFVVQARPETVHSNLPRSDIGHTYRLLGTGEVLADGLAVGRRIAVGPARRITNPRAMAELEDGEVLITETTNPDWEPILKRASALVTETGGRTSHAAIVARELGIPAVVATGPIDEDDLPDGRQVTVSCAGGERGVVLDGAVDFEVQDVDFASLPTPQTSIMLIVGDPALAFTHQALPSAGVGLARMEFVFASHVGVHPLALTRPQEVPLPTRREISAVTAGYDDPAEFLVDRLAQGIGTLAAGFWPRPVILRFSDFKTNEYANLLGGAPFEPAEPNPMLGWRGASRYTDPGYRDGFDLEIAAVRRVREVMGFSNLQVMIPFCRTPEEGSRVLDAMAAGGLARGSGGLEVYVMAEIPSNALRAREFASMFDGMSIGSNDLTQLVLGVDRDSAAVAHAFDERDPAVLRACSMIIEAAHEESCRVGICGQGPSDHPEFAAFLVEQGIDSISVTPDALVRTIELVAAVEAGRR